MIKGVGDSDGLEGGMGGGSGAGGWEGGVGGVRVIGVPYRLGFVGKEFARLGGEGSATWGFLSCFFRYICVPAASPAS